MLWGATPADRDVGKSELKAALELIEREALAKLSGAGPYWFGAAPTLVDFAVYPWLERLPALERHSGFDRPRSLERLLLLEQALRARDSVQEIANATEFYLERYRAHTAASAPAETCRERARRRANGAGGAG